MELLYEDQLRELFIKQELKGFLTRKEWCLLDIIAVDMKTNNIHAFEVKSSKDNAYRVFSQLPYYVWVVDHVWLILGQKQRIPKRLPKWLGIIKFNGETFDRIYEPQDTSFHNSEFHTIKRIYVANYGLPKDGKFDRMAYSSSWNFLTRLIKKWFINSVFRDSIILPKGEKIVPYTKTETALLFYLANVQRIKDFFYEEGKNGVLHPRHREVTEEELEKVIKTMTLDNFAVNRSCEK